MKKNIIIISSIIVFLIIAIVCSIFIYFKDTTYNCGLASEAYEYSRTDIYYINKIKGKIYTQQAAGLYYSDKEEYENFKEEIANKNFDAEFDDEKLSVTIRWNMEEVTNKKIKDIIKEKEEKGYTCKKVK